MKKLHKLTSVLVLLPAALALAACSAAESVGEDAGETPIGSVITGKTRTSDSYLKRVEQDNRRLDRDTWRPQSSERF